MFDFLERKLDRKPGEPTLFVEIHPCKLDIRFGVKQYYDRMQRLRQAAAQRHRRLFSFTLVRKPLDFYRSYFAYFHAATCTDPWCAAPQERFANLTEENMVKVARPNHQSALLWGADRLPPGASRYNHNQQQVDTLLERLQATFDWIGTTEELSTATIPLLSKLMTGNNNGSTLLQPKEWALNVGASQRVVPAAATTANNRTVLAVLQNISQRDQYLYEWVQRTYTLSETLATVV